MAKEEINRATRADAGAVVGASKQQDVAELLKKMKVVADADGKAAHTHEETAAAAPAQADAQADAQAVDSQMVASADSVFASDAASYEVAMLDGTPPASSGGTGLSTGTLLAIGGVALVGGGIAIAANNDSGGGGGGHGGSVTAVTPLTNTVAEGQTATFTVTGTPGSTFSWSVDAAHAADVAPGSATGTVTIGTDGTGIITIPIVNDGIADNGEHLVLTVDGVTGMITLNDPPATDANLTVLTDSLDFSGTSGANHVNGVAAGGNPFLETYSVGDHVIGNGSTILDLKVSAGGIEAVASLEHLGAIDLVNVAGNTNATFSATLWTDVGAINLVDGQDGLFATFTDLHEGVDFSIAAGVAGSLEASFTDNVHAYLSADHNSAISWIANDVKATIANSETGGFELWYTGVAAHDLTLGTVNATVGVDGSFYLEVTDNGGSGTVTVGDVSVAVGKSGSAYVSVTASDASGGAHSLVVGDVSLVGAAAQSATIDITLQEDLAGNITVGNLTATDFNQVEINVSREGSSAAAPAGNVTVGNIDVSVFGTNGSFDIQVSNSGYDHVGNLTVGNATLAMEQGGQGYLYVENTAYYSNASDDVTVGKTTVGNVDATVATDGYFYVDISASAYAATGNATVGDVKVGNVSIDQNVSSTAYFYLSVSAHFTGAAGGAATVGNVTVGTFTDTNNDGSYLYYSADIFAEAGASTGGTIGDVKFGDITINGANGVSATTTLNYDISAEEGSVHSVTFGNIAITGGEASDNALNITVEGADVGPVAIGNLSLDLGATATAQVDISVDAYSGDLASFSLGNVSITAATLASVNTFTVDVQASHNIGPVSFGNLTIDSAESSADVYVNYTVESSGGNIGNVTLGNVDLKGDTASAELLVHASNGDIGNVTVGNVTLLGTGDFTGTAHFQLLVSASDDIGSVTLGNVSLVANTDGFAEFSVTSESTGSGQLGNITLGNVHVAATGASAEVSLDIHASNASAGGSIVVGNVDITINAKDTAASATFNFDVSTDKDITIGNISISVAPTTSAAADNLAGTVSAGGDITIGVISVSDGDNVADNLGDFANVLSVFTAGGDITIAGVDYSGYGASATIDVSGVKGAGTIKGSAFDDKITDNSGTNVITGGGGHDIFTFLDTNTGLSQATADKITDWSFANDKIELGGTIGPGGVNVGNYTEGIFSDFASFLADANGNGKAVSVGLIAGNVFLAIDDNNVHAGADHVIELVGTTNLNQIDVASFV